jgi:hypothetical protein
LQADGSQPFAIPAGTFAYNGLAQGDITRKQVTVAERMGLIEYGVSGPNHITSSSYSFFKYEEDVQLCLAWKIFCGGDHA